MDQISKAAEFIADLRFALRQESQIPETFRPDNLASGYAVQEGVVDRLLKKNGGRAVGYKVACTNKLAQELLGTDTPFYGRLLSPFVYQSPARVKAQDFSMRLIEAEFSFQLAEDLPREGAPTTGNPWPTRWRRSYRPSNSWTPGIPSGRRCPSLPSFRTTGATAVGSGETPPRRGATLILPPTRSVSGSTVRRNSAAQALRFWATP